MFVEDFPKKADLILEGIRKKDGDMVVQGAQNLKDSAGSLGADQIFDVSYRLEVMGVENRFPEAEAILEELISAVEAFKAVLEEV